ncbi:MAG: molecular chaperone HtpG [Ruminococcaceae bacterium]|jgi:molecular chaperone HtpG|nr:molecular chaperone HtpG [Oscillospiraceae bacterium]
MEKREFKAESKRLLDMMINSIYTHKEIFLREIISNASDAIDKLCYRSLTDEKVGLNRDDFAITLTIDKENRTLTVSDNGIGMSDEELENNLGVIAASGSLQFRRELDEAAETGDTDIIGQFGVGFYSAFMVADHVAVVTKKYGEEQAWRWESDGADGYTIEPCERSGVGTDVIMHLKPDGEEQDEYSQYLREYPLYKLVKKYSDYIRFPIRMLMPHPVKKEDTPDDKPEYEEVFEYETLNSMVPLWQRKKSEVTKEEYDKFYQERFGELAPPQSVITVAAEGAVTYKALLFIPSKASGLYGTDEFQPGLQLYSAGVMIMDKCADLLPDEFNFVRGVVESPDLSLNISRELLQHDRQLKIIAGNLEKKIRGELERMLKDEREAYEKFFRSFGRQLKLCAMENYGAKKDKLQDLLLFYSSTEKKQVTLAEYAGRMKEGQKYIYFAPGDSVSAIDSLPQTELVKDHDMEILYFTERTDEFIADLFRDYQGKPFRSVVDGELDLPDEGEKKDESEAYKEGFDFIKAALGDRVTEVKASTRLKSHPVCLSSGQGITFEMEKYFTAVQPELGMKAKRILEINVDHPAFVTFETTRIIDPERAKKYAEVLYHQALLIAGLPIEDPSAYTDLLCSLWK